MVPKVAKSGISSDKDKFPIQPLTPEFLSEATTLLHSVFPDDAVIPEDNPGYAFAASLEPEKYKKIYVRDDLLFLRYFVMLDNITHKVIGTTGLYKHTTDPKDLVWLGWYCIDPAYRGKGLGSYLLQWTIDLAKDEGYSVLKLYTSDDSYHDIAQKVYEEFEFTETGREEDGSTVIYKQLYL